MVKTEQLFIALQHGFGEMLSLNMGISEDLLIGIISIAVREIKHNQRKHWIKWISLIVEGWRPKNVKENGQGQFVNVTDIIRRVVDRTWISIIEAVYTSIPEDTEDMEKGLQLAEALRNPEINKFA